MADLRILIADDHDLIRRGLRDILSAQQGWQVVGEANNGIDAVQMAAALKPDIAILDFSMPGLNGSEAAARIHVQTPTIGVVVLTIHDSEQVSLDVLQAGARGLVLKSDADRDLLAIVQAVSEDRHFTSSRMAALSSNRHVNSFASSSSTVLPLTKREREVMGLLADGMTSKGAATLLQISRRTIESHRININRKLGFHSIADLVRYALRNGITAHSKTWL